MAQYMQAWKARLKCLERMLGAADGRVLTSPRPLYLGGFADVMVFRHFVRGVTYVTGGLTGVDGIAQRKNAAGRSYELMICSPEEDPRAATLISRLARYTLDAALNPGETMDCPVFPGSAITGLVFTAPEIREALSFGGEAFDLLFYMGITSGELTQARSTGSDAVIAELKASKVFPYTDSRRV